MPEKPEPGRELSPEDALRLLEERARFAEDELASHADAGEDVLQYLAENGAPATRRAVAANKGAGPETNDFLAEDGDIDVRTALARKIGRLFPGLLSEERARLRDMTLATLEKLARDEAAYVRAVLAEEIKGLDCVPKRVIKQLASDQAEDVAAPVLEFSPLLDDRDLIEVVTATRASAVLSAIARRKQLGADVSHSIAAKLDVASISALLANATATIRAHTLDKIIAEAAEVSEWHGSLVLRAELSNAAIKRLAAFVSGAYIEALSARTGLDVSLRKFLQRRLEERRAEVVKPEEDSSVPLDFDKALRSGGIDEAFVAEAIRISQKDTVVRALALLAKADEAVVRKILDSGSAQGVIALVWRAGLSMRVAFKLQQQVMRLKGAALIYPRNGVDFPLSEQEIRWQLQFWMLQ